MKKIFKNLPSKLFIALMALITLFPFFYMISAGLMSYQETISVPPTLIPSKLHFENFAQAMQKADFVRYFLNTLFVAGASTLGTLVTSILAGFALVKLQFKGKKILVMVLAALLMVPYEVTVFTNYQIIAKLNLLNTYTALILPTLASIFYLFYLKEYLTSIPISYYNAAKVDGCGDLEFIFKIMIPMSKPALFTMGLLSFITGWNSFIWPILVTNDESMRLLSNGLTAFSSEAGSDTQLQMMASSISIVPILILYLIFRKQIIAGVVRSGIKG